MLRGRLICAQLLMFAAVLGVFAVGATACEGGGGGGGELTSLSTKLSSGGKEGETLTILEGAKVKDKATLTGKNASKATGKANYNVYSEKACKTTVKSAGEVTVSGESVPASNEEELEAGKAYYWQAHYGGDTKNAESTSPCTEILDVQAKTLLSTKLSGEGKEAEVLTVLEGAKVADTATVSGVNASSAGGKVAYKVYSDSKCEHLVAEAGEVSVTGGKGAVSKEEELEGGASYYWQATYKGDSLHQESISSCGKEVASVEAATSLATTLSGGGREGEVIYVPKETEVHDTATLSGTKVSGAGGTVKYYVYSNEECKAPGTEAGEVTVTGGKAPASTAQKLALGSYFWQAVYSGDSLHQGSISPCGSEQETVAPATSLTTSLTTETSEAATVETLEYSPVGDTATLHGENASLATGSVTYDLYSDKECKELIETVSEEPVSGEAAPASLSASLPAGTYYWQASYSGDTHNQPSQSTCGSEVDIVTPPALTTSLSGESKSGALIEVQESAEVTDTATLNAESPGTATGTVTYDVYSDDECKTLVTAAGKVTLESGGKIPPSSKVSLAAGTYFWQASYSGDAKHKASTSECGSEVHIVADATSITTLLTGEKRSGGTLEVEEGAPVTDQATLHGTKASLATGALTYNLYSDAKCEDLAGSAGAVTVAGGSVPTSLEESLPAGSYYWRAEYSGDSANQPSTSACGAEVETDAALTTSLSGDGESGETLQIDGEAPVTDTATLYGANASTATGSVEYNVYSDSKCEHLVAHAGEGTMTEGKASPSTAETLAEGTYYWKAFYKGDSKHPSQSSKCGVEQQQVAAGPPEWVVSVGDSYISGEGGRWAGNTLINTPYESSSIDALGPQAYYGYPNGEDGGEAIPLCHRSKSAEIFIGGRYKGKNFACSGAETVSKAGGGVFKPGLDFAKADRGQIVAPGRGACPLQKCLGQATQLQEFAESLRAPEKIKMIVVSIGGNDFEFAKIIEECAGAFAFPRLDRPCSETREHYFEGATLAAKEAAIQSAVKHVGEAMERAGVANNTYTIVIQDYPSPLPKEPAEFRYSEIGRSRTLGPFGLIRPGWGALGFRTRAVVGACPFTNRDAKWANEVALKKIDETEKNVYGKFVGGVYQVAFMELENAFSPSATERQGRRLCEAGLTQIGGEGFHRGNPWWWIYGSPTANPILPTTVNETEWINQLRIRTWNLFGVDRPTAFRIQEDVHPNFWGQLALRNCLRKEFANGMPKAVGTCTIQGRGLTVPAGGPPPQHWGESPIVRNEPLMALN